MNERVGAALVVLLLVFMAFAGCLGDSDSSRAKSLAVKKPASKSSALELASAVEKRINQTIRRAGDATIADWHVAATRTTSNGSLLGFQWTVPYGANIGLRYSGQRGVVLELAPIVVDEASVPSVWCLAAFTMEQGKASLLGYQSSTSVIVLGSIATRGFFCAAEEKVVTRTVAGMTSVLRPASSKPTFFVIDDTRIKDGLPIYFVLGVRAANETEFGLAIRPMNHFPSGPERPSASLDEFLQTVSGLKPMQARATGSGHGLHFARYSDAYGPTLNGSSVAQVGTETWTTDLKVTERLPNEARPVATVRDSTFRSEFEAEEGWSFVRGEYFGACATGRWDARGDLHGNAMAARSLILYHILCGIYPWVVEYLVFGIPTFTFYAEGKGKATAELDLLVANGALEAVLYVHLGFGATLTKLLGFESLKFRQATTGLAGNVPPGQ